MVREHLELPTLAARLAELRLARGWSQQELAVRAGISLPSVSRLEQGRMAPSLALAFRLADALEVSVEEFRADTIRK